jgi:hypothetical protein
VCLERAAAAIAMLRLRVSGITVVSQRAPLANIGTIFLTVSTIATPEKRKRPNLYEFG